MGVLLLALSTFLLLVSIAQPGLLFFAIPTLALGFRLLRYASTVVLFAYSRRPINESEERLEAMHADYLGVIFRAVGLVVVVSAVAVLYFALLNLLLGGPVSVVGLSITGTPALLLGLWLLRGAPALVTLATPEDCHLH